MFNECTYFETRVEDGLSDSRKAGCRRSGGSLHKSRAWQKTYAPARTQSAVLFCTSVSWCSTFLCTSQDAVSGTFHSTVLRFVKNSTEGRAWNVLFLNTFCTSFFAAKTHSPKPGHVDAFPLYQKYPTPSTLVHWDTIGIIHCRAKTMG